MKFLFRVAIIHTKRKRTGSSLLSSLVTSRHFSLKTCVASLLHTNVQVENFQTCKSAFACAITSVSSQIWYTLLWKHIKKLDVHLYSLQYRTVWSTIVQDFYFKPTLFARKHKCSGNVDGTAFLFLKVWRVAQLCLIFNIWTAVHHALLAMGILQTRILEWVAMPCPGTARLKCLFDCLCVFF